MEMFKIGKRKNAIGIYNPLSAIVATNMGAEILWLSSYSYSLSQGFPDMGFLPFNTQSDIVSRIRFHTSVPIIVDIDNGMGSIDHAFSIAERLAGYGIESVCIENKASPKSSSLYNDPQLLLDPLYFCKIIEKLKSINNLTVISRIENLNYPNNHDLSLTINDCYSAGADCIVIHNKSNDISRLNEIISIKKDIPFGIIPTTFMNKIDKIESENIVLCIMANQLIRAVHSTLKETLLHLANSPIDIDERISSIEKLNSLVI